MPPLAYTALTASIVLSALGAVVICLLTAFYGFTPDGEESPARTSRRALLTRVGHAVAAGCFAATAILLAVVIGQPARSASAPAADARVPALDAKIDAQTQRLHGVEQRMKDSEHTLERLEMEVSEVAARRMGPEAAVTAPPAKIEDKPISPSKSAPRSRGTVTAAKPTAPSGTPAPKAAERPAIAKSAERPATAAPAERPATVTLPADRPAPTPAAPSTAAAPTERAFAPKPHDDPAASPGPPPAASAPAPASAAPTPAPSAPARSSSESAAGNDVRSKLQSDWRAIQRGWDRAADDFRRALAPLRKGD
jgi:hypothetical protein